MKVVAVYTQLSDEDIDQILGVYDGLGELVNFVGLSAGSTNTNYRLEMTEGVFYLRVAENKELADLVFEKRVLQLLDEKKTSFNPVRTPLMVENMIGGHFFRLANEKYAMLFPALRGRELGVFELTPRHLEEVGRFLGQCHCALQNMGNMRDNPYGVQAMTGWLRKMQSDASVSSIIDRVASPYFELVNERTIDKLPIGIIHGDMFMNNTKWHRAHLDAVFDWEMAGRDAFTLDIGIVLNAWCWKREPNPMEGTFEAELCRAIVRGYQSVRPLEPEEKQQLRNESRLAGLRFMLSRVRDFEVSRAPDVQSDEVELTASQVDFLDYREYEARYLCLSSLSQNAFEELVGLNGHAGK